MTVEDKLGNISNKIDSIAETQEHIIDTQDRVVDRLDKAEQVTDVVLRISQSVSEKIVNLVGWIVILVIGFLIYWVGSQIKFQYILDVIK